MADKHPSKNRILNVLPSKKTEDDWQIEHSVQAGVLTPPAALPASVDLREAWWKVGDQR